MQNHMRDSSRLWDYQVLEQLGRGEYGQVFKVRNKKDKLFYALKKVNISSCHEKQKIQAFRQIKALKLVKHPDIIEYYESFLSIDNIYIVMEYASRGDMSKIVRDRRVKQKPFSEQELWAIFTPLVNAIKYLHQMGIIHRDLKLQNIFITEQGKVKVGDLGMSKVIHNPNQLISQRVGTPIYFAPEIIQHQLYSYPVDIWALGCVFYYLTSLQHPFKDATIQTLPYFVIEKDPKPIKGNFGGYLINFINSLLHKSSKTRPNIFDVNISLKNRENPTPTNKVHVFDFKKLLMMKPDLTKLQQFQKNFQRQNSAAKNDSFVQRKDRYQSSSEIKTYRDYIKLNLSQQKLANCQDPQEISSPRKYAKIKNRMPMNLSVNIPKKQSQRNGDEPGSPIKTNGFGQNKSATFRNSQVFTKTDRSAKHNRNYGAFRHVRKPVAF